MVKVINKYNKRCHRAKFNSLEKLSQVPSQSTVFHQFLKTDPSGGIAHGRYKIKKDRHCRSFFISWLFNDPGEIIWLTRLQARLSGGSIHSVRECLFA